jgi:hypothetical protein
MSASKAVVAILAFFAALAILPSASAAPPTTTRVQGYVSDRSGGAPVPANGTYSMTFRLFDAPVAGNLVSVTGPFPVQVAAGLYTADLEIAPESLVASSLFLEVQINAETLAPRVPLGPVPVALVATQARSVAPGSIDAISLAPGAVTPDKIGGSCAEGQILRSTNGAWTCADSQPACRQGDFYYCYDGPPATNQRGICHGGTRSCQPTGIGFGACDGQVLPASQEICDDDLDNDCNGLVDDPQIAHANGLGQNYGACSPLAVPGDPATYSVTMANRARAAWPVTGTPLDTLHCNTFLVVARQTSNSCALWAYQGAMAGHVHLSATQACACPATTDPSWN